MAQTNASLEATLASDSGEEASLAPKPAKDVNVSEFYYPFSGAAGTEDVYGADKYVVPPLDLSKDLEQLTNRGDLIGAAADICASYGFFYDRGACCVIVSPAANVTGCTVVKLANAIPNEELQKWTAELPLGVKLLGLGFLGLEGSLPKSFGAAGSTLEELHLNDNNFSGQLPSEWGTMPSIQLIDLEGNLFNEVQLPESWSVRPGDNASNLWSSLSYLWVEDAKVKQPLPWGWLAKDNETLVPIDGSATNGSPYYPLEAFDDVIETPLNLSFNLSVLAAMDRDDVLVWSAKQCLLFREIGGLQEGACCLVDLEYVAEPSALKECTAIVLTYVPESEPFNLQKWANDSLPAGILGLMTSYRPYSDLSPDTLPETFGAMGRTLQVLVLNDTGFEGTLPAAWSKNVSDLRYVSVDQNNLTGTIPAEWSSLTELTTVSLSNWVDPDDKQPAAGNSFSGTLPSEWSELSKLQNFMCWNGACRNLTGSIPASWGSLCGLKRLDFRDQEGANGASQLGGTLPWKWMYEKSTSKWEKDAVIKKCFPDAIYVPGQVKFPESICLARGHPDLSGDKVIKHNDNSWAFIGKAVGEKPAAEAGRLSSKANPNRTVDGEEYYYDYDIPIDPLRSVCTSSKRYIAIIAVYSVFGFFMLCALADLVLPHKRSCLACLVPEEGAKAAGMNPEAEQEHPAIAAAVARAVPIVFTCSKALLILSDLVSDIIATWTIRDATAYMWGYLTMLLAPNVLAAIVIHLRLSYLVTRQGNEKGGRENVMPHKPAVFSLYQWLARKGGFGVLLLATVVMAPYWFLCEIPILFGAALGHISKRCSSKSWASSSWLHIGHFCSLLSLLMACTESPFSAVVFTFNYARGMSYNFPAMINDWGFVFTVGTALLHIVMEVWRIVPFIKQGKLRFRMKAMFLHLVITANSPQKQVSAVTSSVTSDIVPMSAPGAVAVYRSRSGSEPHMKIVVASADDDIGTSRQQQGDQNA